VQSKFLLLVGDDEKQLFGATIPEERVHFGVNFDQSPSVAILIEQPANLAKRTETDLRDKGIKVGVYGNLDKGVLWLQKVLNLAS